MTSPKDEFTPLINDSHASPANNNNNNGTFDPDHRLDALLGGKDDDDETDTSGGGGGMGGLLRKLSRGGGSDHGGGGHRRRDSSAGHHRRGSSIVDMALESMQDIQETIVEGIQNAAEEVKEVMVEPVAIPVKPREEGEHTQKLGVFTLAVLVFYKVSGGPFGAEPTVKAAGPLFAILGFIIFPFVWAIPEALVTAELGSAFPEPSGCTYTVCIFIFILKSEFVFVYLLAFCEFFYFVRFILVYYSLNLTRHICISHFYFGISTTQIQSTLPTKSYIINFSHCLGRRSLWSIR